MPVVFGLLVLLWIGLVGAELLFVVPIVLPLTVAGVTCVTIGRFYLTAWRVLSDRRADGPSPVPPPAADLPDPAHPHYLLGQLWLDTLTLARRTGPWYFDRARAGLARLTARMLARPQVFVLFPVWLALCGGIALSAVPLTVMAMALGVAVLTVASAGLAAWSVCVAVLGTIERVWMAYRRILLTCPHAGCYRRFALPEYACPNCDARHSHLVPGRLGAFRHVCRCGTRLPTTILLGRFRLGAYCPHCRRRLPGRIGRARVEHLAFVGGPAAGKTTLMFLAVRALRAAAVRANGRAEFVEARDARAYAGAVVELDRGGRLAKTGPELPAATMLDLTLPADHRILYLFDPAGELHTGATRVERLRYLDHGEALLFVIDPFALPELRLALPESERLLVEEVTPTSDEDPSDTLQRLLAELRSRDDQGRQRRIAVVVTKADVLRRTSAGRDLDAGVREWLDGLGLGNTTRTLERTAAEVRYFASGLDSSPAALAELFGWAAGLTLNDAAGPGGAQAADPSVAADPATGHAADHTVDPVVDPVLDPAFDDRPTVDELRAPWPVSGRPAELIPLGHQIGRFAVFAALAVLGPATLALLCLAVYAWFR